MTQIFAVKPHAGSVVHLHLPGYEPGKKRRSIRDSASLCNVGVHGQDKVPLAEALKWKMPDPATAVRMRLPWSWCRPCVGHAAAIVGLSRDVLTAVSVRGGGS